MQISAPASIQSSQSVMGNLASKLSFTWKNLVSEIRKNSLRKINIDESAPMFPPEVIIEILHHLPLKSLIRSQLVCKDWRAMLNDSYFMAKYMDHSAVVYCWRNVPFNSLQQNPEHVSFSYKHGCDGLLLMKNNTESKHCIWNPATRRLLELPDPHVDSHGYAFCFVAATKSYRLVAFYKDRVSGVEGCEVFIPGQSKLWRSLKFPEKVANASNEDKKEERVSVVSAGGSVHRVTKVGGRETCIKIVSLNLETESFTVNHFPKLGPSDDWKNYWDLDWDGKLGIADIVGQNLEVMELENYEKQKWCEKKSVIHLSFLKNQDFGPVFPLFAKKGDVWFLLKDKKIFTYTIETGELTDIEDVGSVSFCSKIYPSKPSLIGFKGMVPDTMLERFRPRKLQGLGPKVGV